MDLTFVIARYMEDVDWAKNLKHVIVQKGIDVPNVGREPASYFWFIIKHYYQLQGDYFFTQGNPFDHITDFHEAVSAGMRYLGPDLVCDYKGAPHHEGLPITHVMQELGMDIPALINFKPACLFRVSTKEILKHDLAFYLRCFTLCCMNKEYPYVFERIFPLIFDFRAE